MRDFLNRKGKMDRSMKLLQLCLKNLVFAKNLVLNFHATVVCSLFVLSDNIIDIRVAYNSTTESAR